MSSMSQRVRLLAIDTIPLLITLALLLISFVATMFTGSTGFMPLLALIAIFYWGVVGLSAMPYWFVFAIGLLTDVITSPLLGLQAASYTIFLAVVVRQERSISNEGFIIKWAWFAGLIFALQWFHWLSYSLFHGELMSIVKPLIQLLLTIGLYPVLARGFDVAQRRINRIKLFMQYER